MKCLQMTIIIQALWSHVVKIRYDKAVEKIKLDKKNCIYIIVIILMVLINYCYHAYIIYA
jgi:hypothetical protein